MTIWTESVVKMVKYAYLKDLSKCMIEVVCLCCGMHFEVNAPQLLWYFSDESPEMTNTGNVLMIPKPFVGIQHFLNDLELKQPTVRLVEETIYYNIIMIASALQALAPRWSCI